MMVIIPVGPARCGKTHWAKETGRPIITPHEAMKHIQNHRLVGTDEIIIDNLDPTNTKHQQLVGLLCLSPGVMVRIKRFNER